LIDFANLDLKLAQRKKTTLANTLNIDVMIRILKTLLENDKIKRTNLAGKAGLNYVKCIKYLNLLHRLELIKVIFDDSQHVVITEKGIRTLELLADINDR
jgi:predicted transcriptional regulator